jgi:ferredoxin
VLYAIFATLSSTVVAPSTPKDPEAASAAAAVDSPQKKVGDLEVVVLHTRCIGAAVCVHEALGSFRLNDKKKALVTDLSANPEATIINAARNCPTQAIMVYKAGKQIWPPPGTAGQAMQPGPKLKSGFEEVE